MTKTRLRLEGLSVLIVEDDYYLAFDSKQALEAQGATVMGPCGDAVEAILLADSQAPDCALVDINLGGGASFAPARALLGRKIPIIFMTGYDASVVPEDLQQVPRLMKPVDSEQVIAAVERLQGGKPGTTPRGREAAPSLRDQRRSGHG